MKQSILVLPLASNGTVLMCMETLLVLVYLINDFCYLLITQQTEPKVDKFVNSVR